MKKILITSAIILVTALSCVKKEENLPSKPVQLNLTLKEATIATSANTFAYDIFNRMSSSKGSGNLIFSPLSISYALSMTANGAAGPTRDSIMKGLGLTDLNIDDLNKSYKDLTAALLGVDSRVKIEIANSIWENKDYQAKQAFRDLLASYYSADSRAVDFGDPASVSLVNNWISGHTNGLIDKMISSLSSDDIMLLINAIYFKGKWGQQFDAKNTEPKPFTLPGSSSVDVPTMYNEKTYSVYKGENESIIELPYGQGNFVMDIILSSGNEPWMISSERFNSLLSQLSSRKVMLYLPKFKYTYKIELSDILKAMGMSLAFSDNADFSNIFEGLQLKITGVLHQAYIKTDEEGTEAAAATVVRVGNTSVGPDDPILFDVDHQFTYVIREVTTNTVLFMGKVTDPTKE
jgi:serine protease inhibitor